MIICTSHKGELCSLRGTPTTGTPKPHFVRFGEPLPRRSKKTNDYFANKGLNNWSDAENNGSVEHQDITRWSNEDYLTYNPTFFDGKWKANFVLGASWYYYSYQRAKASAGNIPNEKFQWNNLGTGTTIKPGESGYDKQTMNSYYFRTNHTILGRYMVGLSAAA